MSVRAWAARRLTGTAARDDAPDRPAAALVTSVDGWVWPYWLQRQLDVSSPAFVALGDRTALENTTTRNWATVGTIGSDRTACVDERGLVALPARPWSFDWWIGAEDRWHVPARSANVRQSLVGDAPVVETRMRVPGGDIVHRVDAVREAAGDGGRVLARIEITNDSAVPVALAVVARPYDFGGIGEVGEIALDGTTVQIDGEVVALLPREPRDVFLSTGGEGDVAARLFAGIAATDRSGAVRCGDGLAQAAFVFALTHRTSLTVALPLDPAASVPTGSPVSLPPVDQVVRGWGLQTDRGMRLVLPEERLQSAVDAGRRSLFVQPARTGREVVTTAAALDHHGFHDEAAERLVALAEGRSVDGRIGGGHEIDATGASLWALGLHWDLAHDDRLNEAVAEPVAEAVEWIEGARAGGLLPAGDGPHPLGPPGRYFWDDLWSLAGLRDAARILAAVGAADAAAATQDRAARLRDAVRAAMSSSGEDATGALPPGPERPMGPGAVGALAAVWPLDLVPAEDPAMAATAEVVRDRHVHDDACAVPGVGLSPALTLHLAGAELVAGDRRALDRLDRVLALATATGAWPSVINPRTGGGAGGEGHDVWTTATFLSLVRSMLVRETGDGLALASAVPPRWYGQGIEVHDAPTRVGRISWAVRWHGARPALLWELDRPDDAPSVVLTCPGLDPTWRTTDERGETLLAEPPQADVVQAPPGGSFA